MSTSVSRRILWLAVVASILLISLAGATIPALAQGKPDGAREISGQKPEAPNGGYPLEGDATNVGSSTTIFSTTLTSLSSFNAWEFRANDPYAATSIKASGGMIGVRADGFSYGVWGSSDSGTSVIGYSNSGTGVYGNSLNGVGVSAFSNSNDALTAQANGASKSGVLGSNESFSEAGYGVRGYVVSSSAASYGGYFSATVGIGLSGYSTSNIAVYGQSSSSYGVYGSSNSFHGVSGYSTSGAGVYGYSNSGPGVYSTSNTNDGSVGQAYAAGKAGVVGVNDNSSGAGYGVRGTALSNNAASYGGWFSATVGIGLYGKSNSGRGVVGESTSSFGLYAKSTSGIGLYGYSSSNIGLYGQTATGNYALYAVNPSKAAGKYAGWFEGNVRINGSYVATGTKSALVYTNQGERLMYAEEATQNYFSDQGTATLKDGRAVIKIDPLFAQTVSLGEGYMVFLTPDSFETSGLGVGNKTADSFEVRELNGGKGNFSFQWRLTALRKGYEKLRMEPAPAAVPPADLPQGELPDK